MLAMGKASSSAPPPRSRTGDRRARGKPREPQRLLWPLSFCVAVTRWHRKTLKRYLHRFDALTKYGGRWFVTRAGFRRAFPELYDDVIAEWSASAHDEDFDD